jgi:ABC-type glutathione transport system ATPase component
VSTGTDAAPGTAAGTGGAPADPPLLQVENLVTRYPLRRGLRAALARRPRQVVRAVDGVSFTLARGEMLALVGESGCGKTTTAQSVLRLVEPDAGTVRFLGRDVTRLPAGELRRLRRHMQLIYQDPYESLDPRFSVAQTVEEPLLVHRGALPARDRAERRRLAAAALERAGLRPAGTYLDRHPHELSGGQR